MDFERYSIDVKKAMDDLYIGPQAEVLEKIGEFNRIHAGNTDQYINVTNKFRWKPGSYDKVKEIIRCKWLEWNKRPSGMLSLFDRERTYQKQRLRRELTDIERLLYSLRSQGRVFLTDVNEITDTFVKFKELINVEFKKLELIFPNSKLEVSSETEHFADHELLLKVNVKDLKINVSVGNTTTNRFIQIVPFGDIEIEIKANLSRWFNSIYNHLIEGSVNTSSYGFNNHLKINVRFIDVNAGLLHPYVTRSHRQWGSGYGNVCLGSFQHDILDSFGILNWEPLAIHLSNWISTYKCNVTGPLNGIQYSFIGKPKAFNDEFWDVISPRRTSECFETQSHVLEEREIIEQCDIIECLLRTTCNDYQYSVTTKVRIESMDVFVKQFKVKDLLPNEKEIRNNLDEFYNFTTDYLTCNQYEINFRFISHAFSNKRAECAVYYLREVFNLGYITIENYSSKNSYHDLLTKLLLDAEFHKIALTHEIVIKLVQDMGYNEPNTDDCTEEQLEMLNWVSELNNTTR